MKLILSVMLCKFCIFLEGGEKASRPHSKRSVSLTSFPSPELLKEIKKKIIWRQQTEEEDKYIHSMRSQRIPLVANLNYFAVVLLILRN